MQNQTRQQGIVPVQQSSPNLVLTGYDGQGQPIWVPQGQIQPVQTHQVQGAGYNQQVHFVQSPGFVEISSVSVSSHPGYMGQMISQQSNYPSMPAQPVESTVLPPENSQPIPPPGPDLSDFKFSLPQVGGFLAAAGVGLLLLMSAIQLGQKDAQIEGIRQGAELVK
jgi:hypothetical protein